jgi:hypothetical protein
MIKMGNCYMEALTRKNTILTNVIVYSIIGIFTLIINFPVFGYITGYLIVWIQSLFYHPRPVIFPDLNIFYLDLTINLLVLLMIEYMILRMFHNRLNRLFKINNLFTTKKFCLLAVIIIVLQVILYLFTVIF